jgi:HupE / UreJ protein
MPLAAALCVAGVVLSPEPARAHDPGLLRVNIVVRDSQRVDVRLEADADALLARLALLADEAPHTSRLAPDEARRRLEAFSPTLLGRVDLRVDGRPITLRVANIEVPWLADDPGAIWNTESAPPAVLHLEGRLPDAARSVTWASSLAYGTFPLTVSADAARDASVVHWLNDGQQSDVITLNLPSRSVARTVARYVSLGYTHILPKGADHILFVLGLCLLTIELRPLLLQVTAFTLAHSATLALGLLGLLRVPSGIVEPLIALSIAFVAIENLLATGLTRWRLLVVFVFGLLHGLGFAGVLAELGVAREVFVPALVSFNVGVELGQLTVVAGAMALLTVLRHRAAIGARFVVWTASAAIALIGFVWTVQRVG